MDIVHGQKGKFGVFESRCISEMGESTLTKISVYAFDINYYLHEFFEPIPINWIFWWPWTIVHGQKGNFGRFWE